MSKQSNSTDDNASKTATTTKAKRQPQGIKGSTTEEIRRSTITLNPDNPKRHTDRQVKQQVANIKANGYLGGIVWNRTTGNLVDGHRRVQALDIIHKYDGTPATDYTLKVEVAWLQVVCQAMQKVRARRHLRITVTQKGREQKHKG